MKNFLKILAFEATFSQAGGFVGVAASLVGL
jgi:hypothetical protein